MSLKNTYTRKIEIYINESGKDIKNEQYKTLKDLAYNCFKFSNDIVVFQYSTQHFDKLAEDIGGEEAKKLNEYFTTFYGGKTNVCSKQNMPYKIVGKKYKSLIPSTIRNSVTQVVTKKLNATLKDTLKGESSLMTFKMGMPIPFPKTIIKNLEKFDDKNFIFDFNLSPITISFKTRLGHDKSNNQEIIERIIKGEYEMSDSSLQLKDNKIFLLLTFQIQQTKIVLDKNKVLGVDLGLNVPAYLAINDSKIRCALGSRESFLKVRLGIQKQTRNAQKNAKFCQSGKGRNKKMKALDRFKEKERNFVKNKNHEISKLIVNFAVKNKCGVINLENLSGIGADGKKEFVLRNWSYSELQQFVIYKAKQYGIVVNKINPKYSSQRCSSCGHIDSENRLKQSEFICTSCGYEDNADYNAAKNISIAHTESYKSDIEKHAKEMEKIKKQKTKKIKKEEEIFVL
jgi:IS605 OrfB family transposase